MLRPAQQGRGPPAPQRACKAKSEQVIVYEALRLLQHLLRRFLAPLEKTVLADPALPTQLLALLEGDGSGV